MKILAVAVALQLGLLSGAVQAAEPTIEDLIKKMDQYESRVQQLEQRLEQAEKRAADAEAALAKTQAPSAAGAGPAPAAIAAQPATVTTAPAPVPVRHYHDQASTPHGEGDGKFPNSWPIPGTDSYLAIGGYVKGDFIQDFDSVGNDNQFSTNSIAIDGSAASDLDGQSTLNARETRFNLDFHKPTELGNLRAFIEGDFAGSGNVYRLRHAYGQIGGLLVGQTWTTFADLSTHPGTLDFEGPDGSVMRRSAQFRYGGALAPGWTWAVSLEEPGASISNAGEFSGAVQSNLPDLPGFVRYQTQNGSVQLAGLLRQLRFDGQNGDGNETETGYGASLGLTRKLSAHDVLSGQFIYGSGVANYVQGLSGQSLDAVLTTDGSLEAITVASGMVAYTHHWGPKFRSVAAYSISDVENESGLTGGSIDRLQDAHLNLIWSPFKSFDLGAELMWGERENQDGSEGDATRLQFSAKYYLD